MSSLWDQLFPNANRNTSPGGNRSETSSGYMDPKWQNPTAKWDPVTHNIVQNPSNVSQKPATGGNKVTAPVAAPVTPTPVLPDPRNDLNPAYDAAAKRIADMQSGLAGDYDKAIQAIRDQYARTSGDIYSRYMDSRNDLDTSAAGLGVNGAEIYKNYDPALRRIQENSDLQQNASTDLLTTLKTLRGQQSADIQASLEQQRTKALADQTAQWVDLLAQVEAAKNAGSSGGGGSGGRGGSGGSSSKVKSTATQTEQLYSVGDIEAYNALLKTNPEAAAVYLASLQKSTGSPLVKQLATQMDEISSTPVVKVTPKNKPATGVVSQAWNNLFKNTAGLINSAASNKKKNNQAIINAALQAAMSNSGIMGNPTNTAKITTTGRG